MIKIKLFVENPIQTNCWVVIDEDSKEAIIIDLGGGYKKIKKYIKEENATLKFVLCTHGHFDHVMGIPEMQEENPDIPVYVSKKDEQTVKDLNKMCAYFGIPAKYLEVKITDFIDEKTDNLYLGNKKIEIIETPGHTQGGLCFKIDEHLFSGDSLFYREIGRCDLPGGDYDTLINSLKTKLAVLPDELFRQ